MGRLLHAAGKHSGRGPRRHEEDPSVQAGIIKAFTDGWRYGKDDDLTNMNVETLSAIVQDAHQAGIKGFTHTVTLNGAKIAASAGVDVLAHGVGDAPVDDELIALLKERHRLRLYPRNV
jgi:imidazolonepropionase-like amidohydrolase